MFLSLAFVICSFSGIDALQVSAESTLSFFVWNAIHESSHAFVANQEGLQDISISAYPHTDPQLGFVFASTNWQKPSVPLTHNQNIALYMAPRAPDTLAVITLPLLYGLSYEKKKLIYPFVIGGLIDMLWGSINPSPTADVAYAFPDPNQQMKVRVIGVTLVVASLTTLYLLSK